MLSASLPFSFLLSGGEPYGEIQPLLCDLRARGVQSAELRPVRPNTPPEDVLAAANTIWNAGLRLSVHGTVASTETAVDDVFAPLSLMLPALRQDALVIVVHPIIGDNAAMLRALDAHIDAHHLPVRIALENNRLLPDKKTDGDSVALVLAAVQAAQCEHVGICWDMGHYLYFLKKLHPDALDTLPPPEFLSLAIHTHVHATNGLTTHFPVHAYDLPLKAYCDALKAAGYTDLFNLELEPKRFAALCDPREALLQSVDALAAACGAR